MFIKRIALIVIALAVMLSFNSKIAAADNFKPILNSAIWKDTLAVTEKKAFQSPIVQDYLNLLINMDDLKAVNLQGWQKEFVSEYADDTLKYLHVKLVFIINQVAPGAQSNEFVYITGVIKDPYAQVATDGVEYEMEKMMLRQQPLYRIWEQMKQDGTIEEIVVSELDNLKSSS